MADLDEVDPFLMEKEDAPVEKVFLELNDTDRQVYTQIYWKYFESDNTANAIMK